MEDRRNATVLHYCFKVEVEVSGQSGGCRSRHGTVIQSPRMGGLADTGPPAVDRPDIGSWGGVAAVRSDERVAPIFPADRNSLDHNRNPASDFGAAVARGVMAGRAASLVRCGDDHGDRIFNGTSGQLLSVSLPAGDYRGQHFVQPGNGILHGGVMPGGTGRPDGPGACWANPPDISRGADGGRPASVVPEHVLGLPGDSISLEPAGSLASQQEL